MLGALKRYAEFAGSSAMWPRRSTIRPIGRPAGSPSMATEPALSAGTNGSSSLTSSMETSPSRHSANSSWAARPPPADALGADRLEDVLHVLGDGDLLPRLGVRGDLEDVGEGVVLGVVVDDVHRALLVGVERAEPGHVGRHRHPLLPPRVFGMTNAPSVDEQDDGDPGRRCQGAAEARGYAPRVGVAEGADAGDRPARGARRRAATGRDRRVHGRCRRRRAGARRCSTSATARWCGSGCGPC